MFYLRQRKIVINLAIMSIIWLSTSFNYYLIGFLVSTFENVYLTGTLSSISELVAYGVGGIVYKKMGIKLSISFSFLIATVGGLLVLFYGLEHESSWTFSVLVLIAKFGIAQNFNIIYVSNADVFPILFCATALGVCNFLSRVFSALSPIISTMEEPLPMIIFTIASTASGLLIWLLQVENKKKDAAEAEEETESIK